MRPTQLTVPRRKLQSWSKPSPVCVFCSLVTPSTQSRPRSTRRFQSTSAASPDSRKDLSEALGHLQSRFPSIVSLSKLQLALRGLQQPAGREAVRVAILNLRDPAKESKNAARDVLRLLLADPLQDEQDWERQLAQHPAGEPLIIRVRASEAADGTLTISRTNTLAEVEISSPELNGAELEILFSDLNIPNGSEASIPAADLEASILEPEVQIPEGTHFTPLATPVHKALLVGEGFWGATRISSLPLSEEGGVILTAVNLKGLASQEIDANFQAIDTDLATEGIQLFRKGPQHGIEYERLWYASNLPVLTKWLRSGVKSTDGITKPVVRTLLTSVLADATARINESKAQASSSNATSLAIPEPIRGGVASWAQNAHAELQDQLDLAFTGKRWRKLGWWKLFWRVDDVAMLTNEMLTQRFLPTAEQELVYLTGQIEGSLQSQPVYSQPASSRDGSEQTRRLGSGEMAPIVFPSSANGLPKWPGHIAFTRRYLQNETVPALQALAQKLVVQSIGTSGLTTSLAALLYVSSFSSTLYEAGAVAALGVMYSLARMQKKWETARGFWEGEVREEGRKAVRAVEESVVGALEKGSTSGDASRAVIELEEARELVAKAEKALEQLK
ncbi:hypothetical protein NLU13_9549 [Sarocladium strictum]|uniref:Mmc1 C-terminal domain-containing protein n=1 Tax=Sarocladium strictum TaxID=5046 RepID=A0AA39GBF5_SARSR|nr:hypothetical protein NLU13_9549 [Sarocladium strictum]